MNALVHRGRQAGGAPVAAVRVAIGLAMLGLAWFEASERLTLRAQTPWLTLAIAGTAIAVASQVAWVLRLRRAVRARVGAVTRRLPIVAAPIAIGAGGGLVSVTGSGTRLYHRADCSLMTGRPATAASADEHRLQRRIACEVCAP